jgi:dihydroxyacid dehydratase/phosphogluconate dehydratase
MESKMPNPTRIEINCETGEVQEIELTDAEVAEREEARIAYEAQKAEEATNAALRAEQKVALLERLGITAEEAELLLG